jgi:hypothetical protein
MKQNVQTRLLTPRATLAIKMLMTLFSRSLHRPYSMIPPVRRNRHHNIKKNAINVLRRSPTGVTTSKLTSSKTFCPECVTINTDTSTLISNPCFSATSSRCYRKKDSTMSPITSSRISMPIRSSQPSSCRKSGTA